LINADSSTWVIGEFGSFLSEGFVSMLSIFVCFEQFLFVEDGPSGANYKNLVLYIHKAKNMAWWECVIVGHPKIDTRAIAAENSNLSDLDGSTRATVEKMMVRSLCHSPRSFSVC
jgi:hypothetical protein